MKKFLSIVPRWLPALVLMIVIFIFSSLPSANLPHFDLFDTFIKKGGHVIGYALLAMAFLYWFPNAPKKAFLLTVLYACTDEFHQSFVAGRGASLWDVILFDSTGALFGLWLASKRLMKGDENGPINEA